MVVWVVVEMSHRMGPPTYHHISGVVDADSLRPI
jgi:hypothetical protein